LSASAALTPASSPVRDMRDVQSRRVPATRRAGVTAVANSSGLSPTTIYAGLRESANLSSGEAAGYRWSLADATRRAQALERRPPSWQKKSRRSRPTARIADLR
jgi:hypothetical protein